MQNTLKTGIVSSLQNWTSTQLHFQTDRLENLEQAVNSVLETNENISKALSNGIAVWKRDYVNNFQEMTTSMYNNVSEILSTSQVLVRKSTSQSAAMVKGLLSPNQCSRGMVTVTPWASYPYTVIRPSNDSVLTKPYLCDTMTDQGGWIVIQRRTNADVDFYRGWEDFKNGFGDIRGNFWLGNENIHRITTSGHYELRVELVYQGKSAYARYGHFSIDDEANKYAISVSEYSGTAGDSMGYHNGHPFGTNDRDNDNHATLNCATRHNGGWWYNTCCRANLNGKWQAGDWRGPLWYQLSGNLPVSYTEMKVRKL
ncbi:fibrinogen-related protein 7-1 [Elysia marginata]|uniref:Fibrinogen-related protein 7-1 n=1 Tax=Elysia marginata TaxID=1093978 RepID=A0AAV4H2I5_9GAST|nr:fibrinogen-related protein 7-1 [Elysia marginata]